MPPPPQSVTPPPPPEVKHRLALEEGEQERYWKESRLCQGSVKAKALFTLA